MKEERPPLIILSMLILLGIGLTGWVMQGVGAHNDATYPECRFEAHEDYDGISVYTVHDEDNWSHTWSCVSKPSTCHMPDDWESTCIAKIEELQQPSQESGSSE